jgi:hypothetical protein
MIDKLRQVVPAGGGRKDDEMIYRWRSRRRISRSIASRIRSARFSPFSRTASMRASMPDGNLTRVGVRFMDGLPILLSLSDIWY